MGLCVMLPTVLPACNKWCARKVSLMHFCYSEDVAIEYLRYSYRCKPFLSSPGHIPCFCLHWQFSLSEIHPVILTALLLDRKQLALHCPWHPLPLNTLHKSLALSRLVNGNNEFRGDRDIPD